MTCQKSSRDMEWVVTRREAARHERNGEMNGRTCLGRQQKTAVLCVGTGWGEKGAWVNFIRRSRRG